MKILIVDDDVLFTRLVKSRLERWDHTVVTADSGNEALQSIKKVPYRIVILKSELPGIGGPEMCRRIRALGRARYTYVMFYADNNDKEPMMAALEAGADDYLLKPFNPVELKLRLDNAKRLLNLEDELREGAGTDAVTGLVNLASFRQFFAAILAESRRTNTTGALMYVEVPEFKPLFAEHGYTPAQTMMAEIGRILGRSVRHSDLVARVDDDLFCALLQNTNWEKCRPVAEKFIERIENSVVYVEDTEIRPKITIAITNYPIPDLSAGDILRDGERIPYER